MEHRFGLFERYGVEIEHAIVRTDTLDVLPAADAVLRDAAGAICGEVDHGGVSWSNELCLHVLELKNTEPAATLDGLSARFQEQVGRVNARLADPTADAPGPARLMPGGMHPWMIPATQTRLWPHDHAEFYAAFDRIFDCRRHGWANVQSVHLNLPFRSDETPLSEFGRLHAAVRLILPLLPALAAASPVMDGRPTGIMDNRLAVYAMNAVRVPSMTGRVIPEAVYTREAYERTVLGPIYDELAPLDPEGLLRHEWANARGAIGRFERGTIEIRLMDAQECPRADVAICGAVAAVLRDLVAERWLDVHRQQAFGIDPLAEVLGSTIRDAERAVIRDKDYLRALGFGAPACTAGDLWAHLAETIGPGAYVPDEGPGEHPLDVILREGPLARRIANALGPGPSRPHLVAVAGRLCDALRDGRSFRGAT